MKEMARKGEEMKKKSRKSIKSQPYCHFNHMTNALQDQLVCIRLFPAS